MKKFSATFMTALMGMSTITHAGAEELISSSSSKPPFVTDTLRCWQNGREIIYEQNLVDLRPYEDSVSATRPDGSAFYVRTLSAGTDVVCSIITEKTKE